MLNIKIKIKLKNFNKILLEALKVTIVILKAIGGG